MRETTPSHVGALEVVRCALAKTVALLFHTIRGGGSCLGLFPSVGSPKHFAVVTRFGQRTGDTKEEGLRFFFLYPHVQGAILMPTDRRTHSISFPQTLSRDSAQIGFEINLAWTPSPDHAIAFLDNGEATGAESALDGIFKDRLRVGLGPPIGERCSLPVHWSPRIV